MTTLFKVQKASESTSKFLARMQANHQKLLARSINKLESNIINSIGSLQTATKGGKLVSPKINLKQAQRVHRNITKLIGTQYNKTAMDMVNDFDGISKHIEKSYKYLGEAASFTGVDKQMIDALKSSTYDQFQEFGVAAQDRINTAMYDSIISQGKFSDLSKTIGGILKSHKDVRGKSMAAYANQYANDAIMNFHNKVNVSKAEDLGIREFLYVGDIMNTTRSFCRERAGGVYTREEIESWVYDWTGKAGPPMEYRGGYNCRHHWRPIRKEWIGDRDRIDVANWDLEQIAAEFAGSVKSIAGKVSPCSAVGKAPLKRSFKNVGGYIPSCQ